MHLFIRGGGSLLEMYREEERRGNTVTVTHDPDWTGVAHLVR